MIVSRATVARQETRVTVKYLRDQRHAGTVAEIAKLKFPFPSTAFPDFETLVNEPAPVISIAPEGEPGLFPDIVVVRRPGVWLQMMAEVETVETVNDESARDQWLPFSKVGDLFIYVPSGSVAETKRLCKKYGVRPKGIRTWRFRPVWGLDITEA